MSVFCLVGSALATDITFPSSVTTGNLADPAVLPLDQRPTASDRLLFTSSPKDLSVSNTNEFMLGGLVFNTERGSYKITVADGTTVKLPATEAVQCKSRWMNVLLKGGTWDFGGTGNLRCNGTWNVGHACTNVIDGASVTNVNLFSVSDYTLDTCLTLTNGAHVTAKTVNFSINSTNKRRTIVIAGGSTVKATSGFQGGTENDENNLTLVTGTGSKLSVPGTYTGSCGRNVGLRVEKGGEIEFRSSTEFDYASKTSSGNFVEVGKGGTFKAQDVHLARSSTSSGFEFRVLEGGEADLNKRPIRLYHDASVIVSNGTLSTGGVLADGGRNSRLRLVGPLTRFTWDKTSTSIYYLFNQGTGHAIELDDHASWESPFSFTWTIVATTNRMTLANGSSFTAPNIQFGYTTSGGSRDGNRIEVLSGSTLNLTNQDFVAGNDNVLMVSNATVHVKELNFGQGSGKRNRIFLAGTTPRFYTDNYLYLSGTEPTLAFDLSDGPLALPAGVAPIQVGGSLYVYSPSMLIKLSGLDELSAKLSARTTMPLFKYAQKFDATTEVRLDAALAAENAVMAQTYGEGRHVLSRTDTTVYLTSKPPRRGLAIFVR